MNFSITLIAPMLDCWRSFHLVPVFLDRAWRRANEGLYLEPCHCVKPLRIWVTLRAGPKAPLLPIPRQSSAEHGRQAGKAIELAGRALQSDAGQVNSKLRPGPYGPIRS